MVQNKNDVILIINYFVPCYPSNLYVNDEENIPYKFMDDDSINYTSYDNTKNFLKMIYLKLKIILTSVKNVIKKKR